MVETALQLAPTEQAATFRDVTTGPGAAVPVPLPEVEEVLDVDALPVPDPVDVLPVPDPVEEEVEGATFLAVVTMAMTMINNKTLRTPTPTASKDGFICVYKSEQNFIHEF